MIAKRLAGTGTTVFSEMTALAQEHGAINLGQGFPDFPAPAWVKEAAREAISRDNNQYAPSGGIAALRRQLALHGSRRLGRAVDADSDVVVTTGATEAIMAAALALLDPGDEVVIFEPFYDSHVRAAVFAGGTCRYVALHPPDDAHTAWWFDEGELTAAVGPKTKLIMLNTPANPCGKRFSHEELSFIAELAKRWNSYVLSDEVYEHILFDGRDHVSIASLPGMWERTLTISSAGKSFSVTGWKIGWCFTTAELCSAVKRAHQFIVFCSATPLQHAVAGALENADSYGYFAELRDSYQRKRDLLGGAIDDAGLHRYPTEGTYFILCDISGLGFKDDVEFCRHLTVEAGVTAIPPSFFFSQKGAETGRDMVRFSFCKSDETLQAAGQRLIEWHRRMQV